MLGAQRLISLEIPVLVQSPKSSNVELGQYLVGRRFKCSPNAALIPRAHPRWSRLINPLLGVKDVDDDDGGCCQHAPAEVDNPRMQYQLLRERKSQKPTKPYSLKLIYFS